MAQRRKPRVVGSVTATISITLASSSRCTRWRTAASDSPTALAIVAYGLRPSCWSCSMMALETSSRSTGGIDPVEAAPGDVRPLSLLTGVAAEPEGVAMTTDPDNLCRALQVNPQGN